MLPVDFITRIQATFSPEESTAFIEAIGHEPVVSVRHHPIKHAAHATDAVPWHSQGAYLPARPAFILDPLFHAGAYYVQESSSMFIQQAMKKLDLPQGALVLDMCAAPGGKSTLLLSELGEDALLVCNEVIRTRVPALKENIQRWGYPNVLLTHADPQDFESLAGMFDLVLVDAPCSGEGLFRKDPAATKQWSPENLETCELRQQRILSSATKLLKKGGYLLYSTCTFNPGENEMQVKQLLANGFRSVPILSPGTFPEIARVFIDETEIGYGFYPHMVKGEGFFLSLLRKETETDWDATEAKPKRPYFEKTAQRKGVPDWIDDFEKYTLKARKDVLYLVPTPLEKSIQIISSTVQTVYAGLALGELKKDEFIPDQAFALSIVLKKDIPHIELSETEALQFLKKESIRGYELPKGVYNIRFNGFSIGWVKAVPGRLNNLLPMEFRIRKNIDV